MARLSIRLHLTHTDRIGPGKIALLEAISDAGSISAGAKHIGMSYRRAWMLVEQINRALNKPAVAAATGGKHGGGARLTPVGEKIISIYRSIESVAQRSAKEEFRSVTQLARKRKKGTA